jgi:hypothetical protein
MFHPALLRQSASQRQGCTQSAQTHRQAKDWLRPGCSMLEVLNILKDE